MTNRNDLPRPFDYPEKQGNENFGEFWDRGHLIAAADFGGVNKVYNLMAMTNFLNANHAAKEAKAIEHTMRFYEYKISAMVKDFPHQIVYGLREIGGGIRLITDDAAPELGANDRDKYLHVAFAKATYELDETKKLVYEVRPNYPLPNIRTTAISVQLTYYYELNGVDVPLVLGSGIEKIVDGKTVVELPNVYYSGK